MTKLNCNKCKIKLTLSNRFKTKNICKDCTFKYQKQYYLNNKEKIKSLTKEWIDNNKERWNLTKKKWRDNNKEKVKLTSRKYYHNNKEKMYLADKKWRSKNKDKVKGYCAKYRKTYREQINAKQRGRSDKMTAEERRFIKEEVISTNDLYNKVMRDLNEKSKN